MTLMETNPESSGVGLVAPRSATTVSVHLRSSSPWQIVVVEGEMDIQVVPLLPDLPGGSGAPQVVFDLLGVTFMDARALGALVDRQRRITREGGCLRLVARSRPVGRLLELTGTSDLFGTFDTLEGALRTPVTTG